MEYQHEFSRLRGTGTKEASKLKVQDLTLCFRSQKFQRLKMWVLILLLFSIAEADHVKVIRSNDDLREAVKLWCTEREAAKKQYGHIKFWDTSRVTDMSLLFSRFDYDWASGNFRDVRGRYW